MLRTAVQLRRSNVLGKFLNIVVDQHIKNINLFYLPLGYLLELL